MDVVAPNFNELPSNTKLLTKDSQPYKSFSFQIRLIDEVELKNYNIIVTGSVSYKRQSINFKNIIYTQRKSEYKVSYH